MDIDIVDRFRQYIKTKYPLDNYTDCELSSVLKFAVSERMRLNDKIAIAASEVDINPTEFQVKSENYKKGHVYIQGLDIAIENPKGSIRHGKSKDGKEWHREMFHHYGSLRRTSGADSDALDVYIGPHPKSEIVFIVNQCKKSGRFNEHKIMLGFHTETAARKAYLAHYPKGWNGLQSIVAMPMDQFKLWVKTGDTTKPVRKPTTLKYANWNRHEHPKDAESGQFVPRRTLVEEKDPAITQHKPTLKPTVKVERVEEKPDDEHALMDEALERAKKWESSHEGDKCEGKAASLPIGTRVVSLDHGSYSRLGTVERCLERTATGARFKHKVILDGESGYASDYVEPLKKSLSWRV